MIVAGVDAGGTGWKLMAARGPGDVIARAAIPTTTPDETLAAAAAWINRLREEGCNVEALGLACFGPIDRNPDSKTYGLLGDTPKIGWAGVNPLRRLEDATGLRGALDTDVNGALLAEAAWGAGKGLSDVAYVTVGAGVGGAAIVAGHLVGAPAHAEFGHLRPQRTDSDRKAFAGTCPFHVDCVEGLASATAIEARWGAPPHRLGDDHEAWPVVAGFLAQLCASIAYLVAPQRIVLGGGVMQRPLLMDLVRAEFARLTNGYGARAEAGNAETYIAPSGLGGEAGALGGVYLALQAAGGARR